MALSRLPDPLVARMEDPPSSEPAKTLTPDDDGTEQDYLEAALRRFQQVRDIFRELATAHG